jgi:hypothetical protein
VINLPLPCGCLIRQCLMLVSSRYLSGWCLSESREICVAGDGEHGAVDADFAAALRGDSVAARDVQGQVRLVGAHDHRRRLRLLPPLPAPPHCAFLSLDIIPCCFRAEW